MTLPLQTQRVHVEGHDEDQMHLRHRHQEEHRQTHDLEAHHLHHLPLHQPAHQQELPLQHHQLLPSKSCTPTPSNLTRTACPYSCMTNALATTSTASAWSPTTRKTGAELSTTRTEDREARLHDGRHEEADGHQQTGLHEGASDLESR